MRQYWIMLLIGFVGSLLAWVVIAGIRSGWRWKFGKITLRASLRQKYLDDIEWAKLPKIGHYLLLSELSIMYITWGAAEITDLYREEVSLGVFYVAKLVWLIMFFFVLLWSLYFVRVFQGVVCSEVNGIEERINKMEKRIKKDEKEKGDESSDL